MTVGEAVPVRIPGARYKLVAAHVLAALLFGLPWFLLDMDSKLSSLIPANKVPTALAAAAVTVWFTNSILSALVIEARTRHHVGHPLVYPSREDVKDEKSRISFICAVRAHENFLEFLPPFFVVVAALYLIGLQRSSAVFLGSFAAARVIYGLGYASGDPKRRLLGFVLSFIPMTAGVGTLIGFCLRSYGLV
eukprot:TRINITY_DN12697_c0_g1_i1.p1 TRINITY_DN12697_c0_g1~~TRINITY_DN12697_c0_g1_i1.p1  ORF type:complete len:202 (-),score=19.87 TRINITY_DN12697_c0_g1_i1:129-704(-)